MTSKQLTAEEVHAIGVAAFKNAISLMADAAVLADVGRPRRGYALGIVAVEEAAKYHLCRQLLLRWRSITVAELNRSLRPTTAPHLTRYAAVLGYLKSWSPSIPLPPGFADLEAVAEEDMRARNRVLYVEVAASGVPMTPEGVSEEEAHAWVSAMVRLFATFGDAWSGELDDALAEIGSSPNV